MDYGIFNMRTDVYACYCTRGCPDTVRESALKVDSGRKNTLPHRRIEPALAAWRSDALPMGYIPTPLVGKRCHWLLLKASKSTEVPLQRTPRRTHRPVQASTATSCYCTHWRTRSLRVRCPGHALASTWRSSSRMSGPGTFWLPSSSL